MKKATKATRAANSPSLHQKASFVYRVLYLIKTAGKLETRIALVLGMAYGAICPIASYVIFHHSVATATGGVKYGLITAGAAGVLISLNNVSALMTELTKSVKMGWCYAILLEGVAMIMRGDQLSTFIGLIALTAVVGANLMKTSYNALLKTE